MGILGWVIIGAIVAWLERQLVPKGPRSSFFGSMVLAWAGAMLANLALYGLGYGELTGFNWRTVTASALGAATIVLAYRLVRSARSRSASPPPNEEL